MFLKQKDVDKTDQQSNHLLNFTHNSQGSLNCYQSPNVCGSEAASGFTPSPHTSRVDRDVVELVAIIAAS